MESDDFVAEDVVACCDSGGNCHGPGIVGCDEGVGGPDASRETGFIDLEPPVVGRQNVCDDKK